jgi:hypothetical protein
MRSGAHAVMVAASVAASIAASADAAPAAAPDFTGFWQHTPLAEYEAVPGQPAPVWDRKHPIDLTDFSIAWEGNAANPILRPETAEEVRRHTAAALAGRPIPSPQEVCQPSGVPNVITLPAPVVFLQQPGKVTIVYQRDHQVRHVRLNVPHSTNPAHSWYGESIGHYDGDTLVIDTVGLNDKTPVDIFGTPHSDAIHVVERYRLINGGRQLEVVFTVEDPKAFTTPWAGRMVYGRGNATEIAEEVCAENNLDVLTKKQYPIPEAARPDF